MTARWPDEVKARVMALRREGLTAKQIGRQLGLTDGQVRGAWRTREQRQAEEDRRRGSRPPRKHRKDPNALRGGRDPRDIPERVLIDRERRMNAELTTHHVLLGDPVVPRWNSNA